MTAGGREHGFTMKGANSGTWKMRKHLKPE